MRIAFLTDIHGNLEAYDAVMANVGRLAVDQIVILGDLVGYGPDPAQVVESVGALVGQGAVCIRGNHDHAVCTTGAGMTENARLSVEWTRDQLSRPHFEFLSSLPMAFEDEDRLYVHAGACKPQSWPYVTNVDTAAKSLGATEARLTFVGHTHFPTVFRALPGHLLDMLVPQTNVEIPLPEPQRAVIVVGSVGQPRDGNPAASFALFDTAASNMTVLRVPYDVMRTAEKVRACGLPVSLADRLVAGK